MDKSSAIVNRVPHHAVTPTALDLFNLLIHPDRWEPLKAPLPPHRQRLFPPLETLSMCISQVPGADGPCRNAVDQAAVQRLIGGLRPGSTATGGDCQARARLPLALIAHWTRATAQPIEAHATQSGHFQGRRVRLIDGTTAAMPDTPAHQAAYPQQRNQKPGVGFPIMRLVGAFNPADGALVGAAHSPYSGKGSSEQARLRAWLDRFEASDGLLIDATDCLLAELAERGIDAVFEPHGPRRRVTDFRRGRRLGKRDHLITLTQTKQKPEWMRQADYARAPDDLTVRERRGR